MYICVYLYVCVCVCVCVWCVCICVCMSVCVCVCARVWVFIRDFPPDVVGGVYLGLWISEWWTALPYLKWGSRISDRKIAERIRSVRTNERTDSRAEKTDRLADILTDGRMDGLTDHQTDRTSDGLTDGWLRKSTDWLLWWSLSKCKTLYIFWKNASSFWQPFPFHSFLVF